MTPVRKPNKPNSRKQDQDRANLLMLAVVFFAALSAALFLLHEIGGTIDFLDRSSVKGLLFAPRPKLDKAAYDRKMIELANYPLPRAASTTAATSTGPLIAASASVSGATTTATLPGKLWPAKPVYPDYGALLPFNRIVAYYGNFYSTSMGVLGQYPPDEVIAKLKAEAALWQSADPATPVIPAIDYIAVTAQGRPGDDGKYRLRMPFTQIDKALDLAAQVHGIVILDVQCGLSDVQTEIPLLEKYLKMPQVHLAIDPEFSMKTSGARPGQLIGTEDAADINYAAGYLAGLVKANHLPPKILIVHRFTEAMVTDAEKINPLPEVEILMDMDGWGAASRKIASYKAVIYSEPVQFAGIKLFYKNDLLPPSAGLMTHEQILKLVPRPSFIQYQ